ncbi:hypothetical protein A33M_4394 [Rhodovulum sp. PH10]|uniref:TA system VapC family ribonuclease toxin n=1 Tax=Rhodovulum sp. PH10 TaxID=1187851 RepID=UPI00027C2E32|nr:TA system VapC family ribonuclease toxin [Rhodovulum sp. PH10]EJW10483.1 hypothetical protein A33M_4394 [Rhodovulum sp. PH10]
MILVDANLLVYAYVESVPLHRAARNWLDARLNGPHRVGLPWPSLLAFLRLVTNPRVFERPVPTVTAWDQVTAWLGSGQAWIPSPGDRHVAVLVDLLRLPGIRGSLVPDAHLAALAIEHDLVLCSSDADFVRFPGLQWENPLAD